MDSKEKNHVPSRQKCNRKAMKSHLQAVAAATGAAKVTLQMFASKGKQGQPKVMHLPVSDTTVDRLVKLSESGMVIGVLPQLSDGKGRRKENVKGIRYLVADLDRKVTKDELAALPVKPSIVVETSTDQYHLYFRVKCPPHVYEERARVLAHALNADVQAVDRNRAFRLAGTINWKPGLDGFTARLVRCQSGKRIRAAKNVVLALGGRIDTPPATGNGVAVVSATPAGSSTYGNTTVTTAEVRAALEKIPASDRSVWLDVGMAIHSWDTHEGFALWDAWSRTAADKYEETRQRPTWDGFEASKGRSIRTLFYYARMCGGAVAPDSGTWLPCHDNEIAAYAANVLADRLKVSDDQYYVFDDGWHADKRKAARLLMGVIGNLSEAAQTSGSTYARKTLSAQCGFLPAQRLLGAMHGFPELDVEDKGFDTNAELLGVPNGVVELRTASFRSARPDDMVSLRTAATYDAKAKCPRFLQFLREIAPISSYRTYLQTVLGYLLVGHGREQKAFVMLGSGSNGKGTLTRLICAVMGADYSTVMSPTLLKSANKSSANGPTPALMALRLVRAIFCTESEQKRGIDEVFFKQLTGNDPLSGRSNYGPQEVFQSPGKLLLSTNVMPDLPFEDEALWRRIIVLPFTVQFLEGKGRDNDLDTILKAEASGVLNWMIEGARRYLASGLAECNTVEKATKKAHRLADTVRTWLRAECEVIGKERMRAKEAYDTYTAYVGTNRLAALTSKQFCARMQSLGFIHLRTNAGYVYKGLRRLIQ